MIQGSFSNHLGIMFGEIKGGGSGGRSPPGKQGDLGGRQAPQWYQNEFYAPPGMIVGFVLI